MPFGVRQSSAAQTNINRARARDSGLCTAAQPVAFCSLAASISLSLIHRSCCAANDIQLVSPPRRAAKILGQLKPQVKQA
jgi:hypothetical protein